MVISSIPDCYILQHSLNGVKEGYKTESQIVFNILNYDNTVDSCLSESMWQQTNTN